MLPPQDTGYRGAGRRGNRPSTKPSHRLVRDMAPSQNDTGDLDGQQRQPLTQGVKCRTAWRRVSACHTDLCVQEPMEPVYPSTPLSEAVLTSMATRERIERVGMR
jgi:hypothetical protein